jgi:tetratricopeptide (TPR) repeat protein
MESDIRDRELIQGYIEGNLNTSEQSEVSYRLKEEKGFQLLYDEYDQLARGIRFAHLSQKLEQLRSLEAGLPPVEAKVIPLSQYWLPVSAAAALVIAVGLWFTLSPDPAPVNERLYAAYFEPFDSPGSGLTRSTDNEQTARAKAYAAYDAGKYKEASVLFVAALKENDDAVMHLCLGSTWLKLNRHDEAEKVFLHMVEAHGDLVTQAKWYLALTYLYQGKIERTKATLWEISKSSTYGRDAREMLKQLD